MNKVLLSSALLTSLLGQATLCLASDSQDIHVSTLENLPEARMIAAVISVTLDSGETDTHMIKKCVEDSLALKLGSEAETGIYSINWLIENRKGNFEPVYREYDVEVFENAGVIDALPALVIIDMSTFVNYPACTPVIPTTSELIIR